MRKRLKSAVRQISAARRLSLFSWRWRQAFVGLALFGIAAMTPSLSHALAVTGISFTATDIPYEQNGLPNGTTIQVTVDTPGQIVIGINRVQNFGNPGTPVAALTYTIGTSSSIFWNGLWLINGMQGRVNGSYQFTVTLTTAPGGTPVSSTSPTLVTLNSVDLHNITITPSLDADKSPTFPYLINYALAKDANVSMGIYNSSGTLVRQLLTNKPQLSEQTISSYTVTWDGLMANGNPAPIGIYTSSMTAIDTTNGGTAIPRSVTFSLTSLAGAATDPKTLFENSIFVYPNPIRDGQGIFQYMATRDGATITLRIYTLSGTLVLDKNFGNVPKDVTQTFPWDASNQSGQKLGRGLYFYVFRESDAQGVFQITKKLAVIR